MALFKSWNSKSCHITVVIILLQKIETTNTATDDLMYWIMNVKGRGPMYGAGINVTME